MQEEKKGCFLPLLQMGGEKNGKKVKREESAVRLPKGKTIRADVL